MSTGFTPGPWEVLPLTNRKYYGTHVRIGRNGGDLVVWTCDEGATRASTREIANGWDEDYGFDHVETAECLANANLIAAAPELYEACVTNRLALIAIADSALEAGFDKLADIIDEQLSKANAALAKARGEQ